jgi:DNA-3-methyladenine glycosylase
MTAATRRPPATSLERGFFARHAVAVARDLIGVTLLVDNVGGVIVEAEAYDQTDPASHSYEGRRTPRNESMFGPAGHAYVYRSYGVHWCLNFVCGPTPLGGAVLIRAIEPVFGLDAMQQRRGAVTLRQLCAGPGRLTQALGITGALDAKPLDAPPFYLKPGTVAVDIAVGRRIGLTRGMETPWRFGLARSPFLSRNFAQAAHSPAKS